MTHPQPPSHAYMQPSTPKFSYIDDGEDVELLADDELYSEVMECGVPLLDIATAMARGYMKGNPLAVMSKMIGTAACDAPSAAIPTGIGSRPAPLNLMFCLVGPSGVGKGTSLDAPIVVASPMGGYRITTPASGEALINSFFEQVPAADGRGSETVRHTDPVWVSWGEIDAFAAKSSSTASTLDAHMRSLFTGERVGDESITRLKSGVGCILDPASYRFVMYVGAQPDHAGVLLDDETGGTLQRLMWLPILDEDAPEDLTEAKSYRVSLAHMLGVPVTSTETSSPNVAVWGPKDGFTVDEDILRIMVKRRSSILRGETVVNPLDTHIDNLRIRLALIFAAWIAGRGNPAHIGKEAWWWACCLVEVSRRTRQYCMEAADHKRKRTAKDAGRTDAERFMAREEEIARAERRKTENLRDKIVDRMRDRKQMKHRELQNAVTNSSNRKQFQAAVQMAVDGGDIQELTDGRSHYYNYTGK